ncbi:hypothetical protein [Pasteuria penetrans]|uniref:hypothetical protein n=1 Tax=Pasteuria penetrans TaxID=86005 RepID=UPI000FACE72F|nr:hypothetical protein [Pasteuria penetrans]
MTEQELSSDVSEPIREHMKQPLKEELSEKLREKDMRVDIQSARLSKLVPTTDTSKEIQNNLKDSPLSAYLMRHMIVDKASGREVGTLVSQVDESLFPPVAFFIKYNKNDVGSLYAMSAYAEGGMDISPRRTKRDWTWGDTVDCGIAAAGLGGVGALVDSSIHRRNIVKIGGL